jgi:tRNA(adenine34) deaminase
MEILDNNYFMKAAIDEAGRCFDCGDVPIGAVIVKDNEIIGKGYNCVEKYGDSTAHAELIAIRKAISYTKYKHLNDCTVYVTLEPCSMCAGAIVLARIPIIVFGAYDPKAGACGSVLQVANNSGLNHRCDITGGILEEECSFILRDFFKELRKK